MVIVLRKTWLLLAPLISILVGITLNVLVMAVNGGQMPVQFPGGCANMQSLGEDLIHTCMTHTTHLKFLCDWIVLDGGVASPGDMFIFLYEVIRWPALIIWGALAIKDDFRF